MKMKRIITLLLALVMAATALPMVSVSAAEEERLTLNVGDSLALDEISGSTPIAAEADGNKYLQVQKMDYNGGEGINVTINPLTVGNKTYKYYYIRFKVRVTNEEYDGESPSDRYFRLAAGTNTKLGAYAYQITTNGTHFTKSWKVSGFTKKPNVVGDGGWTGGDGNPLYAALTDTSKAGTFAMNINGGAAVDNPSTPEVEYAYVYETLADYNADPDKLLRGRWRTDHDTAIPFEIDDIEIGYFTDDRTPESVYSSINTKDFNASFTEANGFRIYTTIDFEDGTLSGKDANGNVAATVSANNAMAGTYRDVDGIISVAVNTEGDYLRVADMTSADSGKVTFDKPLDTGIYTLSGDFRLLYFQNSGRRFKIGKTTYNVFDEGVHEATVTVTDTNGNNLGSFEINPWWDKDELTFALKEPADGIKLTITEIGITEGDHTEYENTVDIKNLKLTLDESFSKDVEVGGGLIDGINMYSTDSTRIVTDDRDNHYLHIGDRNFAKGNDGVYFKTNATLEAGKLYTVTFRARQPVNSDNVVAISLRPLRNNDTVYSTTDRYLALAHPEMQNDGIHCFYNYSGEVHSASNFAITSGEWYTYKLFVRPKEIVENVEFILYTSYLSGPPIEKYRRPNGSSWTNMVNPIEIDDFTIYDSETVEAGKELFVLDFEDGDISSCKSVFGPGNSSPGGATPSTLANTLSIESGSYTSIIGENGGIPKMVLSGFPSLAIGKYSISFDVRLGAYDGNIDYDHNTANIVLKSFLENLNNPEADLVQGSVTKKQIGAEWTKITYDFYVRSSSDLEKLEIGFEALGEGYINMLNRIDYRNLSMCHIPAFTPDIPFNGALMLLIKKRFNERGDGNYLPGILNEENLQYWNANGQTLELKSEGEGEEQFSYLAASDIKNNYSGFVYANGKTLKAGTYLLRADLRTSVEGEDTQLRITLGNVTKKIRVANEWVTFESVFDITEETPVWLRFRGGPLAFYRQSFDIANLTLINLDELERGQTVTVGGNLFPAGDFEDPTVRFEWNGGANEKYGWDAIVATQQTDIEDNGFILVTIRAVNHQSLDLTTGVRVEKGRTYTISYRIRTADHRSDSGMRVYAGTGTTPSYKLKVDGEGAEDPASSWYNSYAINGRWKEVTSTYVAESDGILKLRFSGDTSATSIHDLEIDDIKVYLIFKGK